MMKKAGGPATDQVTFSDTFRDGKPLFEILANPGNMLRLLDNSI
jgi:hypothetical protein